MLHRLAVNLKMDALLFQLSVFSVFNKILSDPAAAAYTVQKLRLKCNICIGSVHYELHLIDCRHAIFAFVIKSD